MSDASASTSPKRKKPLIADEGKKFEEALLTGVLPSITSSGAGFVAVGIDMAAQEGKWGVSVIITNEELSSGALRLLLPHSFGLDGFKKKHPIKPSGAFVAEFLSGLANHRIPAAVAVDVPFGWPQEHSSFLEAWSAVPVPGKVTSPPARSCFEYRLCDRAMMRLLKKEKRSATVLAVGADKIASAAFEWATQRLGLNAFGRVDVGYEPSVNGGVVLFETYPSAFVRLNYPSFAGYKTLKKQTSGGGEPAQGQPAERRTRQALLDAIRAEYSIDTTLCASALEAACATSASDALDSFLSAITAWDYLKWRTRQAGTVRMSSPPELLGTQTAMEEKARIEKEGWFLVRMPVGTVRPHEDVGQQGVRVEGGPSVEGPGDEE